MAAGKSVCQFVSERAGGPRVLPRWPERAWEQPPKPANGAANYAWHVSCSGSPNGLSCALGVCHRGRASDLPSCAGPSTGEALNHPLAARLTALTALTVTTASAFIATAAFAQTDAQVQDPSLGQSHRGHESPQNFAAEVRFAAFTPEVDSDPNLGGRTPYKDTFGSNPRLEVGLEFDWQALRIPHFGTIGPGVSAGYTKASDPALFQDPHGATGTKVSGEQTSLEIFPFYGVLVLRADVLWREAGIPLVPYGKIGLGYALWNASNTLGTSHQNGVSGEGSSFGTQVALGLAFNLNPFDIYAAQNFDDSLGVNNSYIFAEWTRSDLDGSLGSQKDVLRVGGTAWTFGLAFEF